MVNLAGDKTNIPHVAITDYARNLRFFLWLEISLANLNSESNSRVIALEIIRLFEISLANLKEADANLKEADDDNNVPVNTAP